MNQGLQIRYALLQVQRGCSRATNIICIVLKYLDKHEKKNRCIMNQGLQIRYALLQVQLLLQYNTDSKINKLAKLRRCVSRVHFGQWPHGSISSKFGHHMAPLSLVPNLSTKWGSTLLYHDSLLSGCWDAMRWSLQKPKYQYKDLTTNGATSKFGHHMAPLSLVPNLSTKWGHFQIWPPYGTHFHLFQIWAPNGATSKFGHQMAPLALVPNFATRWRHVH